MKKLFRVFAFLCIILIASIVVLLLPYGVYNYVVTQGISSDYIELEASEKRLVGEKSFKLERVKGINTNNSLSWANLPFSYFEVPLPVKHPETKIIPIINIKNLKTEKLSLGFKALDRNDRFLFSFEGEQAEIFNTSFLAKYKIFKLPIFKNYISKKTNSEIWEDMFKKDLTTTFILSNVIHNRTFGEYIEDLFSTSYRELVYCLYIYKLRERFLPENYFEIGYFKDREMGVIYIPSVKKDGKIKEILLFLNGGIIYRFELYTRTNNLLADRVRRKFLSEVKYLGEDESNAVKLYSDYKRISFKERISGLGMIYLFTAWTHNTKNKDFIKEIIYFLERGKNNALPLQVFYEYSYKIYGNNFSQIDGKRKESFEERTKRSREEELQKELDELAKKKIRNELDDFDSDDSKRDYYLQEAKDESEVKKEDDSATDDENVLTD